MKVKKTLLLIIIGIFCFMPVVNAKSDIVIKSVTPDFSTDVTLLNSLKGVDVTFNDLNQTITYDVVIQNNTNKDLYVNSMQISGYSQDFIKYKLAEESRSKVIKSDSKDTITVTIETQSGKLAGRNLNDTINFKFLLNESIENPPTSSNLISTIILVIISAVAITFVMTKFNSKKGTIATVVVCFMLLGTSFVFADDTKIVEMNGKVNYRTQNYLESSGRTISSGTVYYTGSKDIWTSTYYSKVKNITVNIDGTELETYYKKFDLTIDDKNRVTAYLVENGDASVPYDLYISSRGVIYAPENSTALFAFSKLETINGFENIIFDNTVNMTGMFSLNEKLHTLDISNLNTSNVTNTSYMFYRCFALDGIDESKFNLTKVENKTNMISEYNLYKIIEKSVNGNNLRTYTGEGSENYQNKVYYYTGSVTNNNVKFANICWKIVRTTETGGVKLVYNGLPNSSGQCNNTGNASLISTSTGISRSIYNNNTGEEANFNYINSIIQTEVDTWYKNNMTAYTNKLEDTVWCNDREYVGATNSNIKIYAGHNRTLTNKPSLACRTKDSLIANTSDTSRKLTYPTALLTVDELMLSGIIWNTQNSSAYLRNGTNFYTMTPAKISDGYAFMFREHDGNGVLKFLNVGGALGVRPAVSLKPGMKISGGYGTTANPYVIE